MSNFDINVDRRTDGRTDGPTENRTPISHPATSRCDKNVIRFVIFQLLDTEIELPSSPYEFIKQGGCTD